MSFAFAAIGTAREITDQLARQTTEATGKPAQAVTDLVALFMDGETDVPPGPGREMRYMVKAYGHAGGGSAASLNLTIESASVPLGDPPF